MHEFCLPPYFGLIFLLLTLTTESIIELVKNSDISSHLLHKPIIKLNDKYNSFITYVLYKYISCGQCMSVVYSVPGSLIIVYYISLFNNLNVLEYIIVFIIILFSIQRLTNWLNSLYKLLYRGRATAIQFIEPLEIIDMSRVDMTDRDYILNREMFKHKPDVVEINNLSDIKNIITKLKGSKPQDGESVSININDNKYVVNTSTNHPTYMQMIKDMLIDEVVDDVAIQINDSETIIAAKPQFGGGLESLIFRLTGGKKDGNRIKWEIRNDTYYYDPVSDVLTKSEND